MNTRTRRRLEWADVEPLARDAFNIWDGQPELAWAKRAWELLGKAGLTQYKDRAGRYTATFRLLALAGVYCDFCEVAFDESSEIEYTMWFNLDDRFVAGQLYAQDWAFTEEDLDDDAILDALIEGNRDEVVQALTEGFGGVSALYESLWASKDAPADDGPGAEDEGDSDDEDEDDDDDAFACEMNQGRAFEWVSAGCQRLH